MKISITPPSSVSAQVCVNVQEDIRLFTFMLHSIHRITVKHKNTAQETIYTLLFNDIVNTIYRINNITSIPGMEHQPWSWLDSRPLNCTSSLDAPL